MTDIDIEDIDTILAQATADAEDGGVCVRCNELMSTRAGWDPTPMCDGCAQEVLPLLAAEFILLRAQMRVRT